jgi:4-carboxymuconolactone decarboxylase
MTRLAPIAPEAMDGAQRAVYDATLAGRRPYVPAPLQPWLRSPPFAMHAQMLGEAIRFDLHLSPEVIALTALTVASHWGAGYVQSTQEAKLLSLGFAPPVIAAIKAGRPPHLPDPAQSGACEAARRLLDARGFDDAAYAAAVAALGEAGVVELVAAIGYYTLVSLTVVTFDIPPAPATL